MIALEILGAIFSILGAYLMSLSTKSNTKPIYFAFVSFFISNLSLLTFFTLSGKVPVIIQMILFFVTAILGIVRLTANKKRDITLMSIILFIYLIFLNSYVFSNIKEINFEILPIDFIASSIAILGSFILSSNNHVIRSYAFICFFLADLLFVYIGYVNSFYFFMIQSMFYLYTSTKGYMNTMKEEIEDFKNKYNL